MTREASGGAGRNAEEAGGPAGPASVRLDVWLDVACLFKTRSQAAAACKGGKVDVNGEGAKPNKPVKPGDELKISRPGQKQLLVVRGVSEHSLPKAEARLLYEDRTPPPSPEELEMRRLLRQAGVRPSTKSPDKRERRELRRRKEEAPEG
jgi:ribosome-associated heat shock protein Hsp15